MKNWTEGVTGKGDWEACGVSSGSISAAELGGGESATGGGACCSRGPVGDSVLSVCIVATLQLAGGPRLYKDWRWGTDAVGVVHDGGDTPPHHDVWDKGNSPAVPHIHVCTQRDGIPAHTCVYAVDIKNVVVAVVVVVVAVAAAAVVNSQDDMMAPVRFSGCTGPCTTLLVHFAVVGSVDRMAVCLAGRSGR